MSAASAAASNPEDAAAEARANQLLARSIVGKHPEALYTSYSNGGIMSKEERAASARSRQQEKNDSLSQWYGMKRFSKNMSQDMRQDLELLRYRNFLSKDTKHLSSARGTAKKQSPYFELGYFTDVSKKKRKASRRFADEMMNDDPELKARVESFAKREQRRRKKVQERLSKKRDALRDLAEKSTGRKHGGGGNNKGKASRR